MKFERSCNDFTASGTIKLHFELCHKLYRFLIQIYILQSFTGAILFYTNVGQTIDGSSFVPGELCHSGFLVDIIYKL